LYIRMRARYKVLAVFGERNSSATEGDSASSSNEKNTATGTFTAAHFSKLKIVSHTLFNIYVLKSKTPE
jgi:hypothetical protein